MANPGGTRTMPFDQHLFISYAHLDDERDWVKRFHALIDPLLKSRLGRVPSIWRDASLQGNDIFSDVIVHELSNSAVLLSVLSPRYVESIWCRREAQTFCDLAQATGGVVVERKSRIFKIVMIPPDSQDGLPAAMRDATGFEFYEMRDGVPLELDPRYGPELGVKLEVCTAQLAGRISRMLKQLSAAPGALALPGKPTVYLAECSDDRRDAREALRAELESFGHPVLPDQALPRDEAPYAAEVARLLAQCKLSIHLVGSGYGAVPYGPSEQSVVALQNQLAVRQAHSGGLQRVIWLPAGTQSNHPQQQAFIAALHNQPETQFGAQLITADIGKVKEVVKQALAPLLAPPPLAAISADPAAEASVYVIFDRADLAATAPLRMHLAASLRVLKPAFDGDASAVRLADEALLTECDAVLVYYGSGTDAWKAGVDSRLRKALALRGGRRFRAVHTWLAAPDNADKDDQLLTGGPGVIDGRAGFDAALLAPLLAALAGAGDGHG